MEEEREDRSFMATKRIGVVSPTWKPNETCIETISLVSSDPVRSVTRKGRRGPAPWLGARAADACASSGKQGPSAVAWGDGC